MVVARRWMVLFVALLMALTLRVAPSPATAATTQCHRAWVTNWLTRTVRVLDVDSRAYGDPIDVGGFPRGGAAVTPDGRKVVVTTDKGATVVDVATRTAVTTPIEFAGELPEQVAITPNGMRAYVTSQGANEGHVTPIDLATNTAGTPISVPLASTIAVTPDGSRALVGTFSAGSSGVVPIDLATNTVGNPISLPEPPLNIVVTVDGTTALLALATLNELLPLALATGKLGPAIAIPAGPLDAAVTPDGKTALVSTRNPAALVAVNLATSAASNPLVLPSGPNGVSANQVAVSSDGQVALVVSTVSNEVFPVALPTLNLGSPISIGPRDLVTNNVGVAFDPACAQLVVPTTTIAPTTVPSTTTLSTAEPPPPAVASPAATPAVATPAFTG